jgi:hypothetical protein
MACIKRAPAIMGAHWFDWESRLRILIGRIRPVALREKVSSVAVQLCTDLREVSYALRLLARIECCGISSVDTER